MPETDLPVLSVVVPNLNGGATLPGTLESLFRQDYTGLEVIVVDGGSTDDSLDVIRGFENRLAWWVSEKDSGQAHAINKGLQRCRGSVVNWLCSDDLLLPGALQFVGRFFADHPETDVLAGAGEVVFEQSPSRNFICRPHAGHLRLLPAYDGIMQQSCFWRTSLHRRRPLLNESYRYAMDFELWCYFKSLGAGWTFVPDILSRFVISGANKTATGGGDAAAELERVYRTYTTDRIPLSWWYRRFRYPFERLLKRDRGMLRRSVLGAFQLCWMLALMPFYGYGRVRYMSWPE